MNRSLIFLISSVLLSGVAVTARATLQEAETPPAADEPSQEEPADVAAPDTTDTPATMFDTIGQRVIVRVTRHREIMGVVQEEDADIIVIRTLDGKIESFGKQRIPQIVRLVEPGPEGHPGALVMRDGQVRKGIIHEDTFDYVIIEIEGVRARIKREFIDYVELQPSVEERYEHLKKTLNVENVQRHYALCAWLFDEHRYELARTELIDLLSRHDQPEARRLLTIVNAQIKLMNSPPPGSGATGSSDADATNSGTGAGGGLPEYVLTESDVNIIRVYELDFRHPPRVAVKPATIDRLLERYATDKRIPATREQKLRIYRAEPLEIVGLIFELRARDLYPEIMVLSEPHALNYFRQRVHDSWLMNNCATSRCHGGEDAGRFKLTARRSRDPRVRYTNLLTLERLKLDETFPLLKYDAPLDSMVIQYGLPRSEARQPHPNVVGWTPAFRSINDRMVRDTVHWMNLMIKPRPEYPVEFDPNTMLADEPQQPGREPEDVADPPTDPVEDGQRHDR